MFLNKIQELGKLSCICRREWLHRTKVPLISSRQCLVVVVVTFFEFQRRISCGFDWRGLTAAEAEEAESAAESKIHISGVP